jgi:hypothetical protein
MTTAARLSGTLSDWLGTAHANAWRSFEALTLHHAAEDAHELGGVLELGVIHCFLGAIDILDRAPRNPSRPIMIMHTIPQEGAVLQSYR